MPIVLLAGNALVLCSFLFAPHLESFLPGAVAAIMNKVVWCSLPLFIVPLIVPLFVMYLGLRDTVVVLLLMLFIVPMFAPIHSGDTWKRKLQEGVNLSNPHRTAIAIACSEGTIQPRSVGELHEHLQLAPPGMYEGTYIESVGVETYDLNRARVTIVVSQLIKDGGPFIVVVAKPGDSLVLDGTCTPGGMIWKTDSSLPWGYRHKWF